MVTRELNPQAILIEDAQGEIKALVKKLYFEGKTPKQIQTEVDKVIQRLKKQLRTRALIESAPYALLWLSNRILRTYVQSFGYNGKVVVERLSKIEKGLPMLDKGIPNGLEPREYMQQVKDVFRRVSKAQALDPDDVSGRNSMRNRAEMEVRYEYHLKQIDDLRDKGVKLVMCSTHADCSDRCFPWQGRVYSLDHSSGLTEDGKKYVPLEIATDVFYTTKAGKTYKNGLLGFNCRHRLYEYHAGDKIPKISKEEQERESYITAKQREYEKRIRNYREEYLQYKDVPNMRNEALRARKKAIALNKEYIKFSQDNERAFYPDRTKVI